MSGESPFRLLAGMLFVPSAFAFLLLISGTLLLLFGKKKTGKWMLGAGLLFLYLFSFSEVANFLLSFLETPYRNLPPVPAGKIHTVVLLLGGYETDKLRADEFLKLYFQCPAYKRKKLTLIISGTDPFHPDFPEAGKVREFLLERGIPAQEIHVDSQPKNTIQSASHLQQEIGKQPFFLLTSAYHMTRSLFAFRILGMNPVPLPADFKGDDNSFRWRNFFEEILPSPRHLGYSDIAFHEYEGLLFYRLRYK